MIVGYLVRIEASGNARLDGIDAVLDAALRPLRSQGLGIGLTRHYVVGDVPAPAPGRNEEAGDEAHGGTAARDEAEPA